MSSTNFTRTEHQQAGRRWGVDHTAHGSGPQKTGPNTDHHNQDFRRMRGPNSAERRLRAAGDPKVFSAVLERALFAAQDFEGAVAALREHWSLVHRLKCDRDGQTFFSFGFGQDLGELFFQGASAFHRLPRVTQPTIVERMKKMVPLLFQATPYSAREDLLLRIQGDESLPRSVQEVAIFMLEKARNDPRARRTEGEK